MWWLSTRHDESVAGDDLSGQPSQGPFSQWGLGGVLPLVLIMLGVWAIATQHAVYADEHGSMTLHGKNAIALGSAGISAALFFHCHYFWGNIYDQAWFAVLGKIIGAAGFIAAMGVVLVRVGVLGRQ